MPKRFAAELESAQGFASVPRAEELRGSPTKPCLRGPVVAEHPELLHAQIADDDRQTVRPYRQQAPQEELLQESEQAAAAVGLGSASDH